MKILILTTTQPHSYQIGGCPRLFQFCRELSKSHTLSLVYCAQYSKIKQTEKLEKDASDLFDVVHTVAAPVLPPWKQKQIHRLHLAPHFLEEHRNPAYTQQTRDFVARIVKETEADIIYARGLNSVQFIPESLDCPVVVDLIDSLSLLFKRTTELASKLVRRFKLFLEYRSITKYEKKLAESGVQLITISHTDRNAIMQLAPKARIAVIPNGIDCEYFSPQEPTEDSKKLIFTGVMNYGPNEDAALYFAKDIYPLVLKTDPEATFYVVGKDPPMQVLKLSVKNKIFITGTVDDIRPYLASSELFVCPLRFGVGMKNKILAAMAMKLPVVATPLSIEGIDATPEKDIILAETKSEFAKAIHRVIANPELQQQLKENGFKLVNEKYSWERFGGQLESCLQENLDKKVGTVPTS